MNRLTIEAHAKINLGLEVLARRPDGFHDIDTIFQTVSLSDIIVLETGGAATGGAAPGGAAAGDTHGTGHIFEVVGSGVPTGRSNLAWRAAAALIDRTGCPWPSIRLTKRIPVAAGLAGGSTDAAAVLVGMNALFELGLPADELRAVASRIGSDVPFLVQGGTVRGRGRGEILEPLTPLSGVWFVLSTPNLEISAREAYARVRIGLTGHRGFTKLNCSAIQNGDLESLAEGLENDLEAGVVSACPEVGRAKARLLDSGARAAAMCGSGPTVLGLAWSKEEASDIASRAGERDWRIYVAEPITAGCTLTFETAALQRAKRHQRDPEEI